MVQKWCISSITNWKSKSIELSVASLVGKIQDTFMVHRWTRFFLYFRFNVVKQSLLSSSTEDSQSQPRLLIFNIWPIRVSMTWSRLTIWWVSRLINFWLTLERHLCNIATPLFDPSGCLLEVYFGQSVVRYICQPILDSKI